MYHLIQTKVQLIIASVLLCATLLLPAAAHAQGFISNSTYIGGNRTENKSYFTKGDNSESYLLGASDSTGGNTSASGNTYPITLGVPTLAVQSMVLTKLDANTNIVWSRFVGGSKSDSPTDIKYANGFVYIIGNTQSADYPVTNGTTLATGYKTPFYTKLDATTGQIVFSTYLIGNSYSRGIQVVNGGVYITSQLANASGNYDDIRVTKYDAATDALLFNVTYGGTNQDNYAAGSEAFAVAGNDVYIVGSTYSTDFPVTNGSTLRASNNMTYLKLNATTGALTYATYFGGAISLNKTEPTVLKVDNGKVYIYGVTGEVDFPVTDGSVFNNANGADNNLYVTCFDAASNNLVFSKLIGADGNNRTVAMEVQSGIVYLYGMAGGDNFPITVGSPTINVRLPVLIKLNANTGNILYARVIFEIDPAKGEATNMVVKNNTAYLLGYIDNPDFFVTNGSTFSSGDITIVKINDNNTVCFSSFVGAGYPRGLVVDDNEDIYISSNTSGGNFLPTTNGILTQGSDFSITKFNMHPVLLTGADNVTPTTQINCQNGVTTPLTAPEIILPSASMPLLYRDGAPEPQTDLIAKYQWQKANTAAGPWTNVPGAVQQNYTPPGTLTDKYYRRLSITSQCDATTPISISSVAEVLVNTFTAPTINIGNVVNTCVGNPVMLGGAPTATGNGGASIVSYLWTTVDTYAPDDMQSNPTVAPLVTTIYNVSVTDDNGCPNIGQQLANVYSANAGADISSCAGIAVRIGGAPIAGLANVIYDWSASPADPSMSCTNCAQPTVNPNTPTIYSLTLTIPVTGGTFCTSIDDVIVTPIAAPNMPDFAGSDATICAGSTVNIGTPDEMGFTYIWTPTKFLTSSTTASIIYSPTSAFDGINDPATYYLTARNSGCTFIDSVKIATIEASAGADGCGPRTIGYADRTPNINETYTWTKISGPGNFIGATNAASAAVSASVGGATIFQLTVMFNGVTCTDQVTVDQCPCLAAIGVNAQYRCPSFSLNGGTNQVQLIGSGSGDTYTWSPAVGLSAYTGQSVSLTDNVQRTYTLTIGNSLDPSYGCATTINVNNPAWSIPVATSRTVSTCPGTPVNIGAAPTAGYAYYWGFPSPTLSANNVSNPTATVNTRTDFLVRVTDISSGCVNYATSTVSVGGFPPNLAGPDLTLCGPGTVQLGVAAVPNLTYVWTPAASYMPNNTNAKPTVPVAFTTTYNVVATNTLTSCTVSDNVTITITPVIAPFTFINQTFCPSEPSPFPLPAGPAGMASYAWSPSSRVLNPTQNGPFATTTNPRPMAASTYTLIVTNAGGCQASASVVLTPSTILPIAGSSRSICMGETLQLGGASAGGTYNWESTPIIGTLDLNSKNIADPVFTPTAPGVYLFTVSRTDPSGCVTSSTVRITVNAFTLPAIIPLTTICANGCTQIGVPTATIGAQYIWSPADDLSNPNIHNPIACVKTISQSYVLTAIGANGCIDTKTILVGVNPTPSPTITVSNVSVCLSSGTAVLATTVSPVDIYDYQWSPNDGSLSDVYAANPIALLTAVGNKSYTISVTNPTTGCSSVASMSLTINPCTVPLPVTLLYFNGNADACTTVLNWATASEQNAKSFTVQRSNDYKTWTIIGEVAAAGNSTTNRYYQFTDAAPMHTNYYRLMQTDFDGTAALCDLPQSVTPKGCHDKTNDAIAKLYPNPNKTDELTIEFYIETGDEVMTIQIYDMLGQLLTQHTANITNGVSNTNINIADLAAGSYIVKMVGSNNQNTTQKLVRVR